MGGAVAMDHFEGTDKVLVQDLRSCTYLRTSRPALLTWAWVRLGSGIGLRGLTDPPPHPPHPPPTAVTAPRTARPGRPFGPGAAPPPAGPGAPPNQAGPAVGGAAGIRIGPSGSAPPADGSHRLSAVGRAVVR